MVVPDGCPLYPREFEVLLKLARGESHEDVAREMGITNSTVRGHVHSAGQKLDCHTGAELVATCYLRGWIRADRDARGRADAIEVAEAHADQEQAERELAAMILVLASEREDTAQAKREALTPGQALYVQAFMRWLRSQNDDHAVERAFMLRALYYERSMLKGSEVLPPWEVLGPPNGRRRPPKVFKVRISPRPERRTHERRQDLD